MKAEALKKPDDFVDPQPQQSNKKPKGSVASGIKLGVDLEHQRITLPIKLWLEDPSFVLLREEALLKEILQAAFGTCYELAAWDMLRELMYTYSSFGA